VHLPAAFGGRDLCGTAKNRKSVCEDFLIFLIAWRSWAGIDTMRRRESWLGWGPVYEPLLKCVRREPAMPNRWSRNVSAAVVKTIRTLSWICI
jgi:hypothetical protein